MYAASPQEKLCRTKGTKGVNGWVGEGRDMEGEEVRGMSSTYNIFMHKIF